MMLLRALSVACLCALRRLADFADGVCKIMFYPQNDNELAPPRTQLIALTFGVKLVSKYGDWAGFAGFSVS